MRIFLSSEMEASRIQGKFDWGPLGVFFFTMPKTGAKLAIIVSDGTGWESVYPLPVWEHVSVSLRDRCPTWEEMAFVKDEFWEPEETVLQFHPKESEYVRNHPFVLHLWRIKDTDHPLPPRGAV